MPADSRSAPSTGAAPSRPQVPTGGDSYSEGSALTSFVAGELHAYEASCFRRFALSLGVTFFGFLLSVSTLQVLTDLWTSLGGAIVVTIVIGELTNRWQRAANSVEAQKRGRHVHQHLLTCMALAFEMMESHFFENLPEGMHLPTEPEQWPKFLQQLRVSASLDLRNQKRKSCSNGS